MLPSASLALVLAAGSLLFTVLSTPEEPRLATDPNEAIHFSRDIKPLLSNRCFACHGPDRAGAENDLRLDLREHALEVAIVPGDPDASELIARVTSPDRFERMPPTHSKKPALTEEEIDRLRRWIAEGAPYDRHWSYVVPQRPLVPEVLQESWPLNPIDRFLLARLEAEGVAPSPETDRITLIRRLGFDLLGLPPTVEEVDAFLADEGPDAVERLVDRLLPSAHYGERMAQAWLDLVRYGDSAGYHSDPTVPVWLYRDWVIDAFNENRPFDRFTIEQIAGDLLPNATLDQRVAATYNRLNKTTDEGGAQAGEYLAKSLGDRVRTTASVWLGATVGCAECHDHKFDPYAQRDFYRLGAFFADLDERGVYPNNRRPPFLTVPSTEALAEQDRLDAAIAEAQAADDPAAAERVAGLKKRRDELWKRQPTVLASMSVSKPQTTRVLPRGNWLDESGEVVEPGVPAFLPPLEVEEGQRATRLDLARWMVSPSNPLPARVFVNRLWKLFFGKGISARLDDLGSQGEWPQHPELLDWLAVEFRESGWDVKHVVRLMVTSRAYRQSSRPRSDLALRDPENRWVARQASFRVEAELIRDAALRVSGLWSQKVGGPSVKPYQPAGYWSYLNFPTRRYEASAGADQYRRGLYTHWQRTLLHPFLLTFDAPTREECVAERPTSNTPSQALVLLNDPSFVEAARVFAEGLLTLPDLDDEQRLARAFRQAVSRSPEPRELAVLKRLLEEQRRHNAGDVDGARAIAQNGQAPVGAETDPVELLCWTAVTRTLLNLGETTWRN